MTRLRRDSSRSLRRTAHTYLLHHARGQELGTRIHAVLCMLSGHVVGHPLLIARTPGADHARCRLRQARHLGRSVPALPCPSSGSVRLGRSWSGLRRAAQLRGPAGRGRANRRPGLAAFLDLKDALEQPLGRAANWVKRRSIEQSRNCASRAASTSYGKRSRSWWQDEALLLHMKPAGGDALNFVEGPD